MEEIHAVEVQDWEEVFCWPLEYAPETLHLTRLEHHTVISSLVTDLFTQIFDPSEVSILRELVCFLTFQDSLLGGFHFERAESHCVGHWSGSQRSFGLFFLASACWLHAMSVLNEKLLNLLHQSLLKSLLETELSRCIINIVPIVEWQLARDTIISLHIEDTIILSSREHPITCIVIVRLAYSSTTLRQGDVIEELPLAHTTF